MEACKQEGELERTKKRKKKKEREESMDRKGKLEKESQVFDEVCILVFRTPLLSSSCPAPSSAASHRSLFYYFSNPPFIGNHF